MLITPLLVFFPCISPKIQYLKVKSIFYFSLYKKEKIGELMKEFNQDKIKLAHIIDELSAK